MDKSTVNRRLQCIQSHLTQNNTTLNNNDCLETEETFSKSTGLAALGIVGSLLAPALYENENAQFAWLYFDGGISTTLSLYQIELNRLFGGTYSMSVLFEQRALYSPNNIAIMFEDKVYTYEQVNKEANRIAHWAHNKGFKRGDIIALMMENRPEFLFTWIGLSKLGVITAFINYKLPGSSLLHVIRVSNSKLIIVGSEMIDHFATIQNGPQEAHQNVLVYCGENGVEVPPGALTGIKASGLIDQEVGKSPNTNPPSSWRKGALMEDILWYIYTSGTTGLPKAAKVTNKNVFMRTSILCKLIGTHKEDRIYVCIPLYHSSGSVISLTMWYKGGAIVIRRNFSVKEFWDDCRKYDVTAFIYIGEICRYLTLQPARPSDRDHKVRFAIGNGLRPDVWERFQRRFHIGKIVEFYASTEGNGLINAPGKLGAVGFHPWPFGKLVKNKLIKYDLEKDDYAKDNKGFCLECQPGEVGELVSKMEEGRRLSVTSGGEFAGYTDPKATEKKLMRDVFEKGDCWFRTGDLLKQDRQGYYYFVDRIGDTFRWKGENVSTTEVTEAISAFEGIQEANVYGVCVNGYEGRAGMAAVVFKPETEDSFDWAKFYNYLDKNLPIYARPIFIRIQKEIQKTTTFKQVKHELIKQGFNPHEITDPIYLRDDKQKTFIHVRSDLYNDIISGKRLIK